MTLNEACLLCGNQNTRVAQRIPAARLAEAYRAEIGVVLPGLHDELLYLTCDDCGLRFFRPPVTCDERFYSELQKISWHYNAGKQEFRIAAPFIGRDHHVLEIGAGRGLFTREINAASYTGLEFSSTAIELAAADGVRLLAQTVERHAEDHPERYDVVCAFQVLEHVVTRWTDAAPASAARICGVTLTHLIHEPLGKNMRRAYARAMADRWLARRCGFEPELIDARLRAPPFRAMAAVIAAGVRRYLSLSAQPRWGHAVVAVCEKP